MKNVIYFDHAATSYPKPQSVINAVSRAFTQRGGNPGRSGHKLSLAAAEGIFECREAVADLFSFEHAERVVFTLNTTHALNMAIKGLVKPDSHVLTSNLEHNSVIRPLYDLLKNSNKNIRYSSFSAACDDDSVIIQNFTDSLREDTKLAVITLASNICGKIIPIAEIGKICHEKGILLIADGAQACGVLPLDFTQMNVDVLCFPGHKGLYGPQGTGIMLLGEGIEPESTIQGGNGVNSKDPEMNGELPERLEPGTVNTVGICGLRAGIDAIKKIGIEEIYQHSSELCTYLTQEMKNIKGITLYGDFKKKVPVILFNKEEFEPEETAMRLDEKGICVRSGLHCAPIAHLALKSGPSGAVRISLSHTNTRQEADYALEVLSSLKR
jgi:cysteine desulfurase family protein